MVGKWSAVQALLGVAWLIVGLLLLLQWLADEPSIKIVWQTETEFDSAGFNIMRGRSETGPYEKINDRLIPASEDAVAGGDYSFADSEVTPGEQYYYQLEDIDLSGNVTSHAPIVVEAPVRASWLLAVGVASLVAGVTLISVAWARTRKR